MNAMFGFKRAPAAPERGDRARILDHGIAYVGFDTSTMNVRHLAVAHCHQAVRLERV